MNFCTVRVWMPRSPEDAFGFFDPTQDSAWILRYRDVGELSVPPAAISQILETVWRLGQNDFAPLRPNGRRSWHPLGTERSLSVGDVVVIPARTGPQAFVVRTMGFDPVLMPSPAQQPPDPLPPPCRVLRHLPH